MEANEQLVREENEKKLLLQQNAILKAELQKLKMQGIDKTDPPPTDPLFPQPTSVCRVAIKLPPFWPDRPAIWFAQVEAQFSISGISADLTKFNYVIAQLDTRVIGEVDDIILQPPPEDKYGRLKSELIRRLSASEEQRVRQLVSDIELGERRPSQFLRHLRSLTGNTLTDENLLRQLWMRRLPQHFQAILAAQSELSLDKVAELADNILEVSPEMALNLGLRRTFQWRFIIADVNTAIIGSDFLAHYRLLPDCASKRLVDSITGLSCVAAGAVLDQTSVKVVCAPSSQFSALLAEFPSITKPPGLIREPKHNTVHYILTTEGAPVSCRPRRLAPQKLQEAKTVFDDMVQCGTARPSKSSWSSPLHMVPKRDGTWRPCGDYRALSSRTISDRYPVRHIGDVGHNISGCSIFSTIDFVKAYQQNPVAPEDICKTAIITPFGLCEFNYMTFGLRIAGQAFQRFIDEVVQGLDFCFAYVDDILMYSRDVLQHAVHLRTLFKRFEDYGIVINPAKCVFGAPEVTFLGNRISADGTQPPSERIQALKDFPLPQTIQGLRRFIGIGMVNYYRRFLHNAAKLQAPLINAIVATGGRGLTPITWTSELEECFNAYKDSLSSAALLAHPLPNAELGLFTDASSSHVGACLQQKVGDAWQPLGFFSKKLNPRQCQWPAYYRELLAVYESVQHYRHFLAAQHVTIYTDHKPLVYAFSQRRERLPPVQLNQLSFISQFTTDIVHIKGVDNTVADAMSPIEAVSFETDHSALSACQKLNDELKKYRNDANSSLKLENVLVPGTNTVLVCDMSTGRPRPFVSEPMRKKIFA
ncbi:uncharacterized protein LOC114252776 [Bombyx mandarina]|uniref:Uncharacterized protein LOC114252776 n=1 Tax=Bombyx mandarina TaxID=7092 RepID=A0A6J2KM40_BOMMA|nr:uncharacterized protein LOC114252776 [Bombyx mandarina]